MNQFEQNLPIWKLLFKIKNKAILLGVFFCSFAPNLSNTKRVTKFWISSQIRKLLYPDHEPVEFDKILTSESKIRKENYFFEENVLILCWNFSNKWLFFAYTFWLKIGSWQYFMKYGDFSKSVINKIVLFLFLNRSGKLNLEFPFREWNTTLYVFSENLHMSRNSFSRKNPI